MARRHERNYARRAALQTLYASEITGVSADELAEEGELLDEEWAVPEGAEPGDLMDYALMLVQGVEEHLDEIDDTIDNASDNWALDRMPMVDRALLRMTVFEMLHVDEVPLSVSINEAVELAKEFGGEDESHRFVNGVLGKIATSITGGEEVEGEAAEALVDGAEAEAEFANEAIEAEAEGASFDPEADDLVVIPVDSSEDLPDERDEIDG